MRGRGCEVPPLEGEPGVSGGVSIFSNAERNGDPASEGGSGLASRLQLPLFWEWEKGFPVIILFDNGISRLPKGVLILRGECSGL